jgi:general secretion pathway protein G
MKSRSPAGYTLVELMMVVTILSVMASLAVPRLALVLDRAYQGKAKGELGAVRSALQLYYSDTEGRVPYFQHPDGLASDDGSSMQAVLTPTYLKTMPVPYLADPFTFIPGLRYDEQAKINMAAVPPNDIYFYTGAPTALLVNRPYVFNPAEGTIFYCNGNYDAAGRFFYEW